MIKHKQLRAQLGAKLDHQLRAQLGDQLRAQLGDQLQLEERLKEEINEHG